METIETKRRERRRPKGESSVKDACVSALSASSYSLFFSMFVHADPRIYVLLTFFKLMRERCENGTAVYDPCLHE